MCSMTFLYALKKKEDGEGDKHLERGVYILGCGIYPTR